MERINRITLRHLYSEPETYSFLSDMLSELPIPETIKIKRNVYKVPEDLEKFSSQLTYGQRIYLTLQEMTDVGIILRYVAGYYFTQVKGAWNEREALKFGSEIIKLKVIDLYPVSIRLIELMGKLAEREKKLLHREPSADEKAAGIETLNKFSELTSLIFLMDQFKCSEMEVMSKPYDDCLVRFMLAKEQSAYQERLMKLK